MRSAGQCATARLVLLATVPAGVVTVTGPESAMPGMVRTISRVNWHACDQHLGRHNLNNELLDSVNEHLCSARRYIKVVTEYEQIVQPNGNQVL